MKDFFRKLRTWNSKGNFGIYLIFTFTAFSILAIIFIFNKSFAESSEDNIPPRPPQGLEVQSKMEGIDITWRENSEWDIFTYLIYIRTGDQKEDQKPIITGKTNYYSLENLTHGETYYISLSARDNAGNISQPTPEIGLSPDVSQVEKEYSVSGWIPVIDLENAQNSFLNNIELFDYISPHERKLEPDGNITKVGESFNSKLKEKGALASVKVVPSITNLFDKDDIASNLLSDKNLVQNHINNIVKLVEEENLDGIDLDYENIKPEAKDQFTDFIKRLAEALHAKGKILSVTVQAKKADNDNWRGAGATDFEALGKVVDQFKIMTYDYSRLNTPPGAIAPIVWVSEVIDYAKKYVPKEKIMAGIPFYGYKWCLDGNEYCESKGLVYEGVQNIISQYKPTVEWNNDTKAPWFLYIDDIGNKNVINFENNKSLEAKLAVVREKEIGGIAIWRLGSEDPENFNVIKKMSGKELTMAKNIQVKPENHAISIALKKEDKNKLQGYRVKVRPKIEDDISYNEGAEQIFDLFDKENYIIPDLQNGQPYYITIVPLVFGERVDYGYQEDIKNAKLILATPSDLTYPGTIRDLKAESIGTTTINLSFSASGDDYFYGNTNKYEIRYGDKPFTQESFDKASIYPYSPTPIEPKTKQEWEIRGLEPGVRYYIGIRSFDEAGNPSDISNIVAVETIDNIPPEIPKTPEILEGDKSLFIKWEGSLEKDLAGYKIYWKQEKSYYQVAETGSNKNSYILDNLENNYTYHIALSAFDNKGNESAKSENIEAIPKASNTIERMDGTVKIFREKIKANASIFSKRLFSQGAVPYLVMFSVIIINVIIYHSVKREVQKKIDKGLNKSLADKVVLRKNMTDVKRSNRKVLKF